MPYQVQVEYTGQAAPTQIPGGPFATLQAAYEALDDFAQLHHGTLRAMIALIDAYRIIGQGAHAAFNVRSPTKP